MTTPPLKIIFAGTPDFAAVALKALIESHHDIIAVYTQPDRPAGRGRHLTASPVKALALQYDLPIQQPFSLRDTDAQQILADYKADVMIVAAYGLILPREVLDTPCFGCLNIHASLLPRWRGAAPIQRAILDDDAETGVTIMEMDATLDTGPILLQKSFKINPDDTSGTLHTRLANLGAEAILQTLSDLTAEKLKPELQNNAKATYANKITKEEARINWHESAADLHRKIRAFNPWPIAYATLGDKAIRIWQASVIEKDHDVPPGTIMSISSAGIVVAAETDCLRLEKLQLAGGKVLPAAEILHSRHTEFSVGNVLS